MLHQVMSSALSARLASHSRHRGPCMHAAQPCKAPPVRAAVSTAVGLRLTSLPACCRLSASLQGPEEEPRAD